ATAWSYRTLYSLRGERGNLVPASRRLRSRGRWWVNSIWPVAGGCSNGALSRSPAAPAARLPLPSTCLPALAAAGAGGGRSGGAGAGAAGPGRGVGRGGGRGAARRGAAAAGAGGGARPDAQLGGGERRRGRVCRSDDRSRERAGGERGALSGRRTGER